MIPLPFERGEYRRRLQAIREEMARRGLDLLIVNDIANQHYITGYDGWSFYTPQVVLVPLADEEPVWIGRAMDAAEQVHPTARGCAAMHSDRAAGPAFPGQMRKTDEFSEAGVGGARRHLQGGFHLGHVQIAHRSSLSIAAACAAYRLPRPT